MQTPRVSGVSGAGPAAARGEVGADGLRRHLLIASASAAAAAAMFHVATAADEEYPIRRMERVRGPAMGSQFRKANGSVGGHEMDLFIRRSKPK